MNDENFTGNHSGINANKAVTDAFFDPALQLLVQVQFYFKYAVIAIGVFGTAANALVLYALVTHNARDAKKRAINLMIINQNLLDLSCCVFLVLTVSVEVNNVYLTGAFGYFLCGVLLNGTATHCVLYGSIINLVGLTVERYLKVVYPFWSKKYLKRWIIYGAMAFSWIGGIITSAPVSVIALHVRDGLCLSYFETSESNIMYGICTVIIFFFLPLLILIYCYGHIVVVIRRQMRVMAGHNVEGSSQMTASQAQSKRTKWNVIKTMILVSVAFVFCWLPTNILSLVILNSGQTVTLAVAYYVTVFLVYLNICMNPFIYALKHESVKKQLAGLMVCRKPRHDVDATGGSISNQAVGGTKQRPETAHT